MTSKKNAKFGNVQPVRTCTDCGKRCYLNRKQARQKIRQMNGRHGSLSAYACGDYWHVGHLTPKVKRGERAR